MQALVSKLERQQQSVGQGVLSSLKTLEETRTLLAKANDAARVALLANRQAQHLNRGLWWKLLLFALFNALLTVGTLIAFLRWGGALVG